MGDCAAGSFGWHWERGHETACQHGLCRPDNDAIRWLRSGISAYVSGARWAHLDVFGATPRYRPICSRRRDQWLCTWVLGTCDPQWVRLAGHYLRRSAATASAADSREVRLLSRMCSSHRTNRSEEHTSELQSLMRISYAVFCLKKKKQQNQT